MSQTRGHRSRCSPDLVSIRGDRRKGRRTARIRSERARGAGHERTGHRRRTRYGGGTKEVNIPRAYFTEVFAVAPPIRQRDRNYVLAGARYVTGARHEGWVVSVRDSTNRLLAAKASSEPMLQLFRNEQEFDKLLFTSRTSD